MNYKEAATYWEQKDAQAIQMERSSLLKKMEAFILAHNTCALACGNGDFVRCTPIEYTYKDHTFWMLSEGGLKFQALEGNSNVCLAIYDAYEGFGKLGGMQVTGKAELIEPWSAEYLELLAFKKIKAENLKKCPMSCTSSKSFLPASIFCGQGLKKRDTTPDNTSSFNR